MLKLILKVGFASFYNILDLMKKYQPQEATEENESVSGTESSKDNLSSMPSPIKKQSPKNSRLNQGFIRSSKSLKWNGIFSVLILVYVDFFIEEPVHIKANSQASSIRMAEQSDQSIMK